MQKCLHKAVYFRTPMASWNGRFPPTAVAGALGVVSPNPETQLAVVPSKRVLANRRNAQKSTGPRTPEGKARSKRNALKHGLLAKEIFLACRFNPEARNEFETLLSQLQEAYAPANDPEAKLVERMAVVGGAWHGPYALNCVRHAGQPG